MSRKKSKRSASVSPATTPEAVPAEILAEGSGPVGEPAAVAPDMDPGIEIAARDAMLDELVVEGELAADAPDAAVVADDAVADDAVAGAPDAVVAPFLPATMDSAQLKHLVEALVFATDKPITLQRLRQLTRISDVCRLEAALAELTDDYRDRGIALHCVSGGYQFRTNTSYSPWVQQLIAGRPVRLSRAQLETLAIVAYRQPITRPEIDDIRGVDSSATLRLLLDRALIRVLGKREEVGRPLLYGTTKEFLDFFSLSDLRELPTLREYSELTAESRQVMSDRLGVPLEGSPDAVDGGDELSAQGSVDTGARIEADGSVAVFDPAGRTPAEDIPDDAQFEVAGQMSHEASDHAFEASEVGDALDADETSDVRDAATRESSDAGGDANEPSDVLEAGDAADERGYDERDAADELAIADADGIVLSANEHGPMAPDEADETSTEPTE